MAVPRTPAPPPVLVPTTASPLLFDPTTCAMLNLPDLKFCGGSIDGTELKDTRELETGNNEAKNTIKLTMIMTASKYKTPAVRRHSGARRKPCESSKAAMGRAIKVLAANPRALSAVHRQHNAGDELRLVRREEERRVSDVPRRAHLAAQRNLSIAFADQIFLRDVARFHLAFDGHRRVDQSRHDGVHADAVFRIAYGQRLSHRVDPGLGNLVGREARGRADGGDRRYIDNAS